MNTGRAALVLSLVAVAGCASSLTEAGSRVRPVYDADLDHDRCKSLGEVSAWSAHGGTEGSALGVQNAKTDVINQAAEMGATHLVWLGASGGFTSNAKGIAYKCGSPDDVKKTIVANASVTEVVGPGTQNVHTIAVPAVRGAVNDPGLQAALTEVMLTGAAKRPNTKVISSDEIDTMLAHERSKDLVGCNDSASCYAEIGGALGVDALLVASVNNVGATYLASFKLIDVRKAEVSLRATATVPAPAERLIPVFEAAVRSIMDRLQQSASR